MKKGIVASGSEEATQAAVDILESGGNAIDAAVSAVFTSMTSEFALTGAAGGGAMMTKLVDSDPVLYDFFVDTPNIIQNNQIDFFKATIDFGNSNQHFHIGKGSVAVPGNIAGLIQVQEELGKLPLKIVLEPGIDIAKSGCKINKQQSYIFKILKPIFKHTTESRQLLFNKDMPLKEGDQFINKDFSIFLESIIKYGVDLFYKGEIAKLIESTLKEGGLVDYKSMCNYKVVKRKPICTKFRGLKVFTNPAPSAGGSLIIFLLRLLDKNNDNTVTLQKLIQAMSITNKARAEICRNSNDERQYINLLGKDIFLKYLDLYNQNITIYEKPNMNPGRGCTTHVSVMDKDGNCASVTTSNGEGSGYVIPGTGIMLNNMLGEEDLNPDGFHNWKTVRRLSTMMSPTIVTQNNVPLMIIGSGGSNRIRSAMVQVLVNYIFKQMNLEESINSPRIHLEGNNLYLEPGIEILEKHITSNYNLVQFDRKNLFFGGVNAVTNHEGYSDPRRGGSYRII